MDGLTISKIKDALSKNSNIGIVLGRNADFDSIAAGLGLYLSLQDTGKNVSIASPAEILVEHSSLFGINKIKQSLGGQGGDLVVSFPYQEGEIDKVSYTLENGFLNIVVKAGEQGLSFSEKDVKFAHSGGLPQLLFVVGSPRLSDLGSLFNPAELKDTTVVNIDNHNDNQGYGDILLVSTRFSSVSEIVSNLLVSVGLRMDQDLAQNLLSGISYATKNFQSEQTSPIAFEMAGILIRNGAVRKVEREEKFPMQFDQRRPEPRREQRFEERKQREDFTKEPKNQFPFEEKKNQQQEEEKKDENPPSDWLTPKIYKGSTDF